MATGVAERKQTAAETLLLAWQLMHPAGLIPVLGTIDIHRLNRLLQAEAVMLTREEWFAILQAGMEHEIP